MNKRMRDELSRNTSVDVNEMVAKEGYEYTVGYLEGTLKDIQQRVNILYQSQFMSNWQWDGVSDPDDIAGVVAAELSMELPELVLTHRRGDNGDDDVGYELVWFNRKRHIVDIGIVRSNGRWTVVLDTNEGDVPLDCIDVLIEFVTSGGEK